MNKILVTSGLNETWGTNEEIVFLGEWCKEYKYLQNLNNRKHQTLEYHWKNKKKFFKDHDYLETLNEIIIQKLTLKLNEIHNINFSKRQWRIVIGIFISEFIGALWDRYESLRLIFIENKINTTFFSDIDTLQYLSDDFDDFSDLNKTHIWNFILCRDIIKESFSKNIKSFKEIPINKLQIKNKKKIKKSFKFYITLLYDKIIKRLKKKYQIVISESYFDFFSLIKINFKLKQLPRFYYEFHKKIISKKIFKSRNQYLLDINPKNDFELLIQKIIFKYLPKSYLENFDEIINLSKINNIKCEKIYTAIGHLHNDLFNIWSAIKINEGVKYYVAQHGGSIRPKTSGDFDHQLKISDRFITWHKEYDAKHKKLTPNKLIKIRNTNFKNLKSKNLTIIGYEAFMYTHRPQSTLHGGCMAEEYLDCLNLYKNLDDKIKKNVKFRFADYSGEEGWYNTKYRLKDVLGNTVISEAKSMLESFKTSKMLICKYPQTTFAEAMSSDLPTILVYNKKYWDFNNNFTNVVKNLNNNNILFDDIREATKHINFYWNNLDEWWLSKDVLLSRENFMENCCKYNSEWINELKNFFLQ